MPTAFRRSSGREPKERGFGTWTATSTSTGSAGSERSSWATAMRSWMTPINHELEIELAEDLCRTIPCAEMVRYAKCGGEACAMAVRIARGATGRDKILFCGYHGWHDWYLAANLDAEASLNEHLFPGIEPAGVPRALAGTSIPFPFCDLPALGQLLDDHRGQVAAVIMEPLRSEMPPEGYLASVRKLCDDSGVV